MTRERISRSTRIVHDLVRYSYPPQAITLSPSRRWAGCIIAMSVELRKMGEAARCCPCPQSRQIAILSKDKTGVLRYLCRAGQRPVSRETLLQEVWGYNSGLTTHTLETHIHRLRQKIEKDAASPAILVTEAGGYTLVP